MFFGDAVLVWPQEIEKKVFNFVEFVFGASEIRQLFVEYPSLCCVNLEDVRQVVNSCNYVVHGRAVRHFGVVFLVFKEEGAFLSVWLPHHQIQSTMQQFGTCSQGGPVTITNVSLRGLESPWTGAQVSSLRREASLWSSNTWLQDFSNCLIKESVAALIWHSISFDVMGVLKLVAALLTFPVSFPNKLWVSSPVELVFASSMFGPRTFRGYRVV